MPDILRSSEGSTMSSASMFLLAGAVLATVLSLVTLRRHRPRRSPLRSADEFQEALRKLSSSEPRRRRR
jgi:hypothetical protein